MTIKLCTRKDTGIDAKSEEKRGNFRFQNRSEKPENECLRENMNIRKMTVFRLKNGHF